MRIEALSTLVAVVWLTAVLCPRLGAANLTLSFSHNGTEYPYGDHVSPGVRGLDYPTKRMTYREMNMILRQEGGDGLPVACCPAVEEVIEPVGGRNRQNMYVELFRDEQNVQRFYEYSCRSDVLDKPCRFIDRKFSNQSRCVQTFSYTYAIVADIDHSRRSQKHEIRHHHKGRTISTITGSSSNGTPWALDFIKLRSGCSCEIMPKSMKKKKTKRSKIWKSHSET